MPSKEYVIVDKGHDHYGCVGRIDKVYAPGLWEFVFTSCSTGKFMTIVEKDQIEEVS